MSSGDEKNKALARRFLEAAGEAEQRFEALYVLAMDLTLVASIRLFTVGLRRGILSSVKPKRSEYQESASRRLFGTTTLEGVKGE